MDKSGYMDRKAIGTVLRCAILHCLGTLQRSRAQVSSLRPWRKGAAGDRRGGDAGDAGVRAQVAGGADGEGEVARKGAERTEG